MEGATNSERASSDPGSLFAAIRILLGYILGPRWKAHKPLIALANESMGIGEARCD